jgi:hypothetical protein
MQRTKQLASPSLITTQLCAPVLDSGDQQLGCRSQKLLATSQLWWDAGGNQAPKEAIDLGVVIEC